MTKTVSINLGWVFLVLLILKLSGVSIPWLIVALPLVVVVGALAVSGLAILFFLILSLFLAPHALVVKRR